MQKKNLQVYVHIDPASITLEDGFTRDVSSIGHWGTGDLEINIQTMDDLKKAEPFLLQGYEQR